MARRYYSSTAARTTLASGVNDSTTTFSVAAVSGWPTSFPYTLVIDQDTINEEIVEVTARSGTTLTVTRGVDGTTGVAHDSGAAVNHGVSARDFDEPNSHVNDGTTDVHPQYLLESAAATTYVSQTGGSTITNSASATVPLTVKDASGQSVASLKVTDSTDRVGVDAYGGGLVRIFREASGSCVLGQISSNDINPARISLFKSRGTNASPTVVQDGDNLGLLAFSGYSAEAGAFRDAAYIQGWVDGTPDSPGDPTDMPGRLTFSTSADGSALPTERMRIDSNGNVQVAATGPDAGGLGTFARLAVRQTLQSQFGTKVVATDSLFDTRVVSLETVKAANSNFQFVVATTAATGSPDSEFNLRGDGNGYADGTWSGGGADYAEYFEWSDSNPNGEDRRGIAVTLDGDKIKPAEAGDTIIGVISGNPSVVGDAAWNKWHEKYLRDEFGSYVMEDYSVLQWTDEEGNEKAVDADGPDAGDAPADATVVVQQRRKLNPAYDPEVEYVSREDRPEWDCVGLMGKLRVRKGQPTDPRWIKMRDVSDSVEEWLVR